MKKQHNDMGWKRVGITMTAAVLALSLCACGGTKAPADKSAGSGAGSASTSAGVESIDLTGLWRLHSEKNDLKAFQDKFPGFGEFGAGMELKDDGTMFWFIGAEGGSGTYTYTDEGIQGNLTSDTEHKPFTVLLKIAEKDVVAMEYNGETVYWAYGNFREDDPANGGDAALEGQAPTQPDKSTGSTQPTADTVEVVNRRGDTITLCKQGDGTYVDEAKKVYNFDGVDAWFDADGVEWNETVK